MEQMTIGRNIRGELSAKTTIELGAHRILRIETSKAYNGGLKCSASAFTTSADGMMSHAFDIGGRGGGDFSKVLARETTMRATEKAIRTMHTLALSTIDATVAECVAHYSAKVPA